MQQQFFKQANAGPFRWLMEKTLSYWYKKPYRFQLNQQSYTLVEADNCSGVVILARCHYQEYQRGYPITQLKELKQILNMEYPQHNIMHFIGPVQDQRRQVVTIEISSDVLQQLDKAILVLPETLLLWQANLAQPCVLQTEIFAKFFLYNGASAPVSQLINHFCPNLASFNLNNGIPEDSKVVTLCREQFADKLATALLQTVFLLPKIAYVNKPKAFSAKLPYKAMALSALSVVLVYGGAVTFSYHLLLEQRQSQLAALGSEVNALLTLQQQLEQTALDAEQLALLRQDKYATAHLWQVLLPLLQVQSNLQLQSFALEQDRIILRGQAEQATAILTTLQQHALVTEASFDAPVRRQRDQDAFVIALKLVQHALPDATSETTDVEK